MKKMLVWFLLPAMVLCFGSCARKSQEMVQVNLRGNVFGTYYSILYFAPGGTNYQLQIDSIFADFNKSLSFYDPTSLITKINNNQVDTVDTLFERVYSRSVEIYQSTGGAFDPTVSPLVNAWGFGFSDPKIMTDQVVDSLIGLVGLSRTRLQDGRIIKDDPRIQFDFNAIAKGYAADVIARWFESIGIYSYLVEIGGDLMVGDAKPDGTKWRVALEHPSERYDDPQEWFLFVELENQAITTSGNYRRYFERDGMRFSHTIDPVSGRPVTHNLLSVSVIAEDAITADAYATAFMVMGFEKSKAFLENRQDMQAFFVASTGPESYVTFATPGLQTHRRSDLTPLTDSIP